MGRSPFADFLIRYDAGDVVFAAGDPGTTLFVVQSGRFELRQENSEDAEVLGVMEKGDFFGEMSLLEGAPRTFSARALEPAEAIEIGPALFDRMIRSNIELAVRMLRKLSIRLAEAETRLAERRRAPAGATPAKTTASPAAPAPATDAPPPAPPGPQAAGGDAPAGPGGATAYLVNPEGNEVFPIGSSTIRVGRFDPVTGTRPEVDLTLLDLKRSVSRRHAVLVADDGGFLLSEEVGALNGTLLNDTPLVAGQPVRVRDGDRLSFGGVTLRFQTKTP